MRSFLVRVSLTGAVLGFLTWLGASPALAQAGRIEGQVTEVNTGRPLSGAQVFLEGRTAPAISDEDGNYVLTNVPVGAAVVRVRLIGYSSMRATLNVPAGGVGTANFELSRSAISLDEIVVTGTGREVETRKLASPVTVISTETIDRAPVTDVAQLLQGKVAGGTVNATSAQAGTSGLVNFRGISSVYGAQSPVIYVDGVRMDNSEITASWTGGEQSSAWADILISDIDRVEITKGGAASTLYGSDAATGVIQIFTKRGRPGRARVTARMEQGSDSPELKYMFDTGLIYPDEIDGGADPEFLKNNYFQTGHFQNYYLGTSGGTDRLTYNLSGRIQQSDGVQPKNESNIFNLRGSVQADVSEKVSANFSANYTRSKFGRLYNGSAIADPLTSFEVGDVFFFTGEDNFDDALTTFISPDIDETVQRFTFSSGANLRVSDLLTARATVGLDYRSNTQREVAPIGAVFINGGDGSVERSQRDFISATIDAAGTLSWPTFNLLTNDFTVGIQGFRQDVGTTSVTGNDFALPGAPEFDEAGNITATEGNSEIFNGGVYLQDEISLAGRLFLSGGVRFDANSAFGDDVNVEAYPKAGVSYLLSDEPVLAGFFGSTFNTLKLRASYGQTGKFPGPFLRDRSFNATQFRGQAAPRFNNPGNEALGPEVQTTVEFGFDLAALDNRIGVGFTYFDATTDDALLFVPEQTVTGLGTQLRNVGQLTNQGIEVDANLQLINSQNLRWNIGATYSAVKNRVTDMGGAAEFGITGQQRVLEGAPVGVWRVFTPVDSDGDGKNDSSERLYGGLCDEDELLAANADPDCLRSPTPTKNGSFNTSITLFGSLTISGNADWATGHRVFDFGSVWATFNAIYRRELIEDDYVFPVRYETAADGGEEIGKYSQSQARSAMLLNGDWLKLREIAVRWELPESVLGTLGFDRASLYGNLRNVAIFSDTPMIDPELNGIDSGGLNLGGRSSVTLSPPKSFRLGLEVVF